MPTSITPLICRFAIHVRARLGPTNVYPAMGEIVVVLTAEMARRALRGILDDHDLKPLWYAREGAS